MGCGTSASNFNVVIVPSPVMKKVGMKGDRRRSSMESTTVSDEDIRRIYHFEPKVLGYENFGSVRKATLINSPGMVFAVKTIQKAKVKKDIHFLKRELEILKSLSHPNIVKFYQVYQDSKYFHLVMEFCRGGDLVHRLLRQGQFNEYEAMLVMKKVFLGVAYLHEQGVVHRDLKPENLLFASEKRDAEIKIIDFGLANKFGEGESYLHTMVGTPLYMAPEILTAKYTEACDNWSLGAILHTLLIGHPPFMAKRAGDVYKMLRSNASPIQESQWGHISSNARDLVRKLLERDPAKRLTSANALQHPWFSMAEKYQEPRKPIAISDTIFDSLKSFRASTRFKREAMQVLVRMLSESEINELKQVFSQLDVEKSGVISVENLQTALRNLGMGGPETEINEIIQGLELDKSGQIDYLEFVAATLDVKQTFKKERLWAAFKHFAVDDRNFITKENLKKAMARSGRLLPDSELIAMIEEVNGKEGKISFEQFCQLMVAEDIEPPSPTLKRESRDLNDMQGVFQTMNLMPVEEEKRDNATEELPNVVANGQEAEKSLVQ